MDNRSQDDRNEKGWGCGENVLKIGVCRAHYPK